jgi:hypothetical protein
MWNVKTTVIPVIIGATGTISKSFRKYVSTIPGNHAVKEPYYYYYYYYLLQLSFHLVAAVLTLTETNT